MSRVDDSDNQRIREMQETEYRNRVDREKRDNEARTTRSFNEVMSQKNRGQLAKQAAQNKKTSEERETQGKNVLDQVRGQEKKDKTASELGRKAALSRAANSSLLKKRAVEGQASRVDNEQRTDELTTKGQDDKDRIETEVERDDEKEAVRTEERQAEHRLGNEHPDRVDADGQNQRQQQQQREPEREAAEAIGAAEGPAAPHKPSIPPDLIEKIVGRLFQAINPDGRTSLQVDLKGEGLEGVTLKIAAEHGRVSCTFEGCSPELKSALRSGKPALTRGLAKRGMKLVALRVS